ncbi:MAG TPA: trypsin-like peptidase domain-containing protein [Tepidisphaeraceae bacterium]|nr:trypsin-like peptidase domain-containing protein [Tepidisphaeraceae bacterium]
MGFRLNRPRGTCAVLALAGVLAASCSSSNNLSSGGRAIAAADHIQVIDNFSARDLEQRFEDVAKRVSPSVVAISATESAVETDATLRSDDLNPDKLASMLEAVDRTVGTGFVVDSDGYILTNDHVVSGAEQLWVTTDSHKVYPAIVVGTDPRSDLAILKIPATHLPVAHFAQAATRRGQWTIAIGNPYGLAGSGEMAVSIGVVSALNRSLPRLSGKEDRLYSGLVQTTAQINPGNSGGPLFDLNGDVIGINTAVILPQKQTNGIGFAIPADAHVRRIVENLKQGREVVYGYMGVRVTSPTPRERRDAGLTDDAGGVRVESVEANSPAAKANLKPGDILTQLDGEAVRDSDDFVRLVGMCPVGEPVKAVLYDNGARTLDLALRSRPTPNQTVTRKNQRLRWRGMLLGSVPIGWDLGPSKKSCAGVLVIGVDSKSAAVQDGIKAGCIITSVAGKTVHNLAELQRIINDTPAAQCRLEIASPAGAVVSIN